MKLETQVTETKNPQQRGREIGDRWAPQIRHTCALYLDFFSQVDIDPKRVRAIAESSLDALQDWCPGLALELTATAEGAGLPVWQLAALNARTEILAALAGAALGECSTAVFAPDTTDEAPRTIQTWDWHDALVPHGLLLQLTAATGMTVKLFTEFGMLGKIGVNSAGLGLHFNILHHRSDNASGGVPVHAIARRVLEEAQSVDEAIELARSARVSASTVLTVFSRHNQHPRAASIEMSPQTTALVLPGADGWITHTNHFLAPELETGDRTVDDTTHNRLAHVDAQRNTMRVGDLAQRARAFCGAEGEQAPICFHPDPCLAPKERWETLLTIAIDTERGDLLYRTGTPMALAENGYLRF